MAGGIDYVRQVVVHDSLGICDQLEADMARHVATYACEWKAAIDDPAQIARFTHFVNTPSPDPSLAYRRERGQKRPLRGDERANRTPVAIATGDHASSTDRRG